MMRKKIRIVNKKSPVSKKNKKNVATKRNYKSAKKHQLKKAVSSNKKQLELNATLLTNTVQSFPEKKTRKHNYLNNKDIMYQIELSKLQGKMTNELAKMIQLLCARYARRGNFVNYSYRDDMEAYAVMMLVRTWQGFNPKKSNNPFAFFTQCIKHSFIQFLNQEKRQRDIRDELMVSEGLNPSFSYQDRHEKTGDSGDTQVEMDNEQNNSNFEESSSEEST